jgi:hypothetical protein
MSTSSSSHHDRKIKINDIFIKKLNYRSNAVNATHIYVQPIDITTVINYIF